MRLRELEEREELISENERLKEMSKNLIQSHLKGYEREIKDVDIENIKRDYLEYVSSQNLTFEEIETLRKYNNFLISKVTNR